LYTVACAKAIKELLAYLLLAKFIIKRKKVKEQQCRMKRHYKVE